MIQVNELRIGNYVESPLGEIMKVTILGDLKKPDYIHAENNEGFGQNGFEPIPLTPEILDKCANTITDEGVGFSTKYYRFKINKKNGDGIYLRKYHGGGFIWGLSCTDGEFEVGSPKIILFIHQLQNLYFALTGEELNINL